MNVPLLDFYFIALFGYIQTFLSCCCHIWDDLEGKEKMWTLWTLSFGVINNRYFEEVVGFFPGFLLVMSHRYFEESVFRMQTDSVFAGSHLFWVIHRKVMSWKGPSRSQFPHPAHRKGCHSLKLVAQGSIQPGFRHCHLKKDVFLKPFCLISLSAPWGWLHK